MFKRDKTPETESPETPKKKVEETAYEDSWYRSLKALAEREPSTDDEAVEDPED